jgi:hypothetical protein
MKHVVQYSFGEASWYEGILCARKYGAGDTLLLFADTLTEDEDTYAWGRAAAGKIGAELVEISDGRDIWQVFRDERFLGNSRVDPCSKILKRQLCDAWVRQRYSPDQCVLHYGIGLFEKQRLDKIQARVAPYRAESLLCQPPYPTREHVRRAVLDAGLWVQKLYRLGFDHANCGGRCVKAGHKQWLKLLEAMPDRYADCEREEAGLRELLGDVAILRDRRGGVSRPMTLTQLRLRHGHGEEIDAEQTVGGCACFQD